MAAAFAAPDFEPVDVHMTDLIAGRHGWRDSGPGRLRRLLLRRRAGRGRGLGKSILFNARLREQFASVLRRGPTRCHARRLQRLPDDVGARQPDPGTASWPRFVRNRNERAVRGPARHGRGAAFAVAAVAGHDRLAAADRDRARRGRAEFAHDSGARACHAGLVLLRYALGPGVVATTYPANPPSKARMWVAMRSRNQRSCEITRAAGKARRPSSSAQRLDVEVVGRLVQQQHVAAALQHLGEVHAVALAARELADQLLLLRAPEVERPT